MWRVLVIDDDQKVHILVKKIIGSSGVTVLEAHDGAEGLSLAFKRAPDLILCDMMMPVMDGMQFLREWSTNEAISHIPVMMVTSASEKNRIIEAVKLGACDYIVKPFDPLGLRSKVSKVLEQIGARRSTRQDTAAGSPRKERPLVLVASESETVRRQADEALRGAYDVIKAEDGAECLHETADRRPDLVLLSSQVPLIPSEKVVKNITSADETQHTRIALLAPPEEIRALDETVASLLVGTVELPIEPEALRASVDRMLDRVGFFFFDRGDLLFLKFQPGGLEAAAADLETFDKRVRSEFVETFDAERQRLVVDLRLVEPAGDSHAEPVKHLLEQTAAQGIKARFQVASNAASDAVRAMGVSPEHVILEEPEGAPASEPDQPAASAASTENSV